MKTPRIFVDEPLESNRVLELTGEAVAHLRALRLRPGGLLVLFNGRGGEYTAELLRLERRSAEVMPGTRSAREAESPMPMVLIQGVSKGDRMDWTIQKAVELGVSRIVPVFAERSVVQLSGDRLEKRAAHWRGVVRSACEQCGRNVIPALETPVPLTEVLTHAFPGQRCVLDPAGGIGLGELPRPDSDGITLLIGPEGGLADDEIAAARGEGYRPLLLGPRVLRTETAGIAALAALQTLWGDFR